MTQEKAVLNINKDEAAKILIGEWRRLADHEDSLPAAQTFIQCAWQLEALLEGRLLLVGTLAENTPQ